MLFKSDALRKNNIFIFFQKYVNICTVQKNIIISYKYIFLTFPKYSLNFLNFFENFMKIDKKLFEYFLHLFFYFFKSKVWQNAATWVEKKEKKVLKWNIYIFINMKMFSLINANPQTLFNWNDSFKWLQFQIFWNKEWTFVHPQKI